MGIQMITGPEYNQWLTELKDKIRTRQLNAALKVNSEMIGLYWDLGKAITEKVANSNWGDKIISQLAKDLKSEFKANNGLSRSNLFYICKFYKFYEGNSKLVQQPVGLIASDPTTPLVQTPVGLFPAILEFIPWGHHIHIFSRCKSVEEAIFIFNRLLPITGQDQYSITISIQIYITGKERLTTISKPPYLNLNLIWPPIY